MNPLAFLKLYVRRKAIQKFGQKAIDAIQKTGKSAAGGRGKAASKIKKRKEIKNKTTRGVSDKDVRDVTVASGLLGASGAGNVIQNRRARRKIREKEEELRRQRTRGNLN